MSMILAANANAQGSHFGEWRHPDAWDKPAANISNAMRLAQIAEAGKMDLLFLADGNGVRNMDKPDLFAATLPSDRPGVFEPMTLLSALAMVTKHIGLNMKEHPVDGPMPGWPAGRKDITARRASPTRLLKSLKTRT